MKKMKSRTVILSSILFMFTFTSLVYAGDYDHEIQLDRMSFAWKVNKPNLDIKLSAKTESWVGIGFNPIKKMKGANFIIGYVKDGQTYIRDEYGNKVKNHKSDEQLGTTDDVNLKSGILKDGQTTIEFSIPIDSGDINDGKIDTEGDTTVLLSHGPKDKKTFRKKHYYRATLKVNLGSGKFEIISQKVTKKKTIQQ